MKKSKIIIVLLIGFLGFSFSPSPPTGIPSSGKSYHSIESEIERLVQRVMADSIPGLTVAVSKNGRLVYSKGFGYANYENKTPMKRTHRTRIGSVSKIITAIGIMKLTEMNSSFDLNRKLYYSGGIFSGSPFKNAISEGANKYNTPIDWYRDMKVRHLLSHTIGYGWSGDGKGARKYYGLDRGEMTYQQFHQYMLRTYQVKNAPGTRYDYSNHALGLCGEIIRTITGENYGRFIDDKIFNPLGLHNKIVKYNHKRDKYDSYPHKYKDGKIQTLKWEYETGGLDRVSAAGDWASSAESLVKLMSATDQLSNQKDILKSSTLDLMEKRPFPNVRNSHAIGWEYSNNGKKLSHGGAINGGRAFIAKYKKGFTSKEGYDLSNINVAVCANSRPFSSSKIRKLASDIAKVVAKKSIPKEYDLFSDVPGRYLGIWRKNEKSDQLWVGANWDHFVRKRKDMAEKGYILVDMDTYKEDGKRLFNGVWRKADATESLQRRPSWNTFDSKWKNMKELGYHLMDIEIYKEGDNRYHVGVFRKSNGANSLYRFHNWPSFTEMERRLHSQGQRLIDVETYTSGDRRWYVGVWRSDSGKSALYKEDSWRDFENRWKRLRSQGRYLLDVETFKVGNQRHFIGVWKAGTSKDGLYYNMDWNHFQVKRDQFKQEGMTLVDLERW